MNRFPLVSEPNYYPCNSSIFPDMEEGWINGSKYFRRRIRSEMMYHAHMMYENQKEDPISFIVELIIASPLSNLALRVLDPTF